MIFHCCNFHRFSKSGSQCPSTENEAFKRSQTTVIFMPGGNKLCRFLTNDTKHFLSVVVIKIALFKRDMTQLSRISNSIKTARMVMWWGFLRII